MNTQNQTQGTRVPRPMGTTEKGLAFNKDHSPENKQRLEQHLINHYLTTNFTYCNKHYNMEELSILLNIPHNTILEHTLQYGNNVQGLIDTMTNFDSIRAIAALALKSALEDRGRAIEQYSILRASQGAGYKAFVSSEVNKALKLVMETGSNLGTLIKNVSGGPTVNILTQNNIAQEGPTAEKIITIDEAVMLIKKEAITPLGLNPKRQEGLFIEHGLEGTPEVCALKQEGVDTSKEGLNINNLTKIPHIDRRAHEEGFNLDEDLLPN